MIKYILVVLSSLMVATAAVPEWMDAPLADGYSTETHFIATGQSASLFNALSNAQGNIAAQLETKIETSTTITQTETDTGSDRRVSKEMASFIRSDVAANLANAKVVRQEKVDGIYYVMVVMEKATYLSLLRTRLDRLYTEVTAGELVQKELAQAGKVVRALEQGKQITQDKAQFHRLADLYNGLSAVPYDKTISTDVQSEADITAIASGVDVLIKSGQNQIVSIGGLADEPVVMQVMFNGKFVSDFGILCTYPSGEKLPIQYTDANGEVRIPFYGVPNEPTVLNAKIVLDGPAKKWSDKLPKPTQISYTLEYPDDAMPSTIDIVKVTPMPWEMIDTISNQIKTSGYIHRRTTPIRLFASITYTRDEKVKGFVVGKHLINGQLILRSDKGNVIKVPFTQLARHKQQALKKVANRLQIPRLEIYKVLGAN